MGLKKFNPDVARVRAFHNDETRKLRRKMADLEEKFAKIEHEVEQLRKEVADHATSFVGDAHV